MNDGVTWSSEKCEWLLKVRGLSFDLVLEAAELGEIDDDVPHHSSTRPNQRIMIIRVGRRHVAVPYVTDGQVKFLKTMYFSRDLDELYGDQNGKNGE